MAFRIASPRLGLSVEMGTAGVPRDSRYHVMLEGEELFASSSERKAVARYTALKNALTAKVEEVGSTVDVSAALRREMADIQAQRFLSESSRQKRAKALRKGGKGGSGGVG